MVAKLKKLGAVIEQLQSETHLLDALISPSTPLEQIATRKDEIEELATHHNELQQHAKKVTDSTTQVWGNIVQDEQLKKLTTQLQEADKQLVTLKTSLKEIPFMMQITKVSEVKEL